MAAREGGKEIVLTGVNIGEFGKDNGQDFFTLLKRLDEVKGIERYRISSIEPNLLTDDILHWIATESRAFKHHFHIPLQSGSDNVLKLMNRRYETSLFRDKIALIRELMPDAFIGVDVIAGARGETEDEWIKSLQFIDSLDITRLHVFPYSERPGTKALLLGDAVDPAEKHRRVARLTEISDRKLADFMQNAVGQTRDVLWEHRIHGTDLMSGLTDNYLRVSAPFVENAINTISPVLITGIDTHRPETVTGKLLDIDNT